VFFASDARPRAGVREVTVAVDVRQNDLDLLLLRYTERADGAGGADLGTQRALVLAVAALRATTFLRSRRLCIF
jgi:hypothetical protein